MKSLFPDETDLERADVLDFGVGHDHLMNILLHDHGGSPIPDKGIQSLTKVLHAARDSLGVEFCPLLPDVTCLLLSYMPVSNICPDNCIFMYVLSCDIYFIISFLVGKLCIRNNTSNGG